MEVRLTALALIECPAKWTGVDSTKDGALEKLQETVDDLHTMSQLRGKHFDRAKEDALQHAITVARDWISLQQNGGLTEVKLDVAKPRAIRELHSSIQ